MKRLSFSPRPLTPAPALALALTASLVVTMLLPDSLQAQQQAQSPAKGSVPDPAATAAKPVDAVQSPAQTQAQVSDQEKTTDKRSPEPNANAASDAQVQGLLFFASNDPNAPAQEEKVTVDASMLTPLDGRLKKVFPFSNFHLIGKHTQKVFKEYESWVVPSKDLCLKIDSRGPAEGGGVNVHLQLWQDTKVLVKSDSVIRPGQPIFLGGPKWRGGRLIFVVMLKG